MDNKSTYWFTQTEELTKIWFESNQKMWNNWLNVAAQGKPTQGNNFQESFLDSGEVFMRLLQISIEAWKEISPLATNCSDWQTVLNKYSELIRSQFFGVPGLNSTFDGDASQMWQLYVQSLQSLTSFYPQSWLRLIESIDKAGFGQSKVGLELNNLYWDIYEKTFGSFFLSPSLGYTREFNYKLLQGFEIWKNYYRASIDYQIVLAQVRVQAFEKLIQQLVLRQNKGEKVENTQQFLQIWSQVIDQVFAEIFSNQDNIQIRGKFLNATMAYKLYLQKLMEVFLKIVDQPVRSEVDEIHHSIYELNKDIKALKKALEEFPGISD